MSLHRRVALAFAAAALLPAAGALAQLDDTCKVSALNRTAPVDASGVWVLTNVPSASGETRVRATCFSGGVTLRPVRATGSDPLDIHSFNLARALSSITLIAAECRRAARPWRRRLRVSRRRVCV